MVEGSPVEAEHVAERFRWFARQGCPHLPVYHRLSLGCAADRDVLRLMVDTRHRQWRPNLLFAAVHDLLLQGAPGEIADWYPTIRPEPTPSGDPFPAFRTFVMEHRTDIVQILQARRIQTNEPNRSWLWRLGIPAVTGDLEHPPIALLELGAAAGLNLAVDRYRYVLNGVSLPDQRSTGPMLSTVDDSGAGRVPLDGPLPRIVARLGLDLDPASLHNDDDVRWIKACIWPEELDRHRRFDVAVEMVRRDPPSVRRDDLVDGLSDAVDELPDGAHLVVVNSWTLTYVDPARRRALETVLELIGRHRDLSWLSAEANGVVGELISVPVNPLDTGTRAVLLARQWRGGVRHDSVLASCDPQLAWIDWMAGQ